MNTEDVIKEVRRQGKAAVAAQAAAEACLDAVEQLNQTLAAPSASNAPQEILEALLPMFDALDRVAAQAKKSQERQRNLLERLRHSSESAALAEGIRLLHAQLGALLKSVDVQIDRRVGVPFDPEAHRAVEVRPHGTAGPPTVTEVVSAGYRYRGRRLREADVVVSGTLETKQ